MLHVHCVAFSSMRASATVHRAGEHLRNHLVIAQQAVSQLEDLAQAQPALLLLPLFDQDQGRSKSSCTPMQYRASSDGM